MVSMVLECQCDRMLEKASGSGRVRDCVCVRVSAGLSAWKVMDERFVGRGVSRGGGGERVATV